MKRTGKKKKELRKPAGPSVIASAGRGSQQSPRQFRHETNLMTYIKKKTHCGLIYFLITKVKTNGHYKITINICS